MKTTLYFLLLAGLLCAASGAVAAPQDREGHTWNPRCPVSPEESSEADIYVEYEGEDVHFCCNRCRRKFLADPTAYLAALPQFATHLHTEDGHAELPHDHGEHGSVKVLSKPLTFLGKFHPLVVHFPIALILAALLAEGLGMWWAGAFFPQAARFLLALGAVGAVVAAGLGWLAATGESYSGDLACTLFLHRWLGVSVAFVSSTASILSRYQKCNGILLVAYRAALVLCALLVGITGHLGATLIYGANYFTW